MHRSLLRAPRCYQEASRVLASGTSTAPRHAFLTYGRVRTLTSASHLSTEHHPPSSSSMPNAAPVEEFEAQKPQQSSEASQHIPWYLQEESSVPAASEVTSREKLPELPENPPKILPEVLEYVFKDLGLDELKLLDLRPLETPAALGANVIMIVGTARSVKHLNVSADRLCRWLRSEYKLSPYADGLLGRNELKIKLRRKTKRARIASRTGAMFDDKDDGITTGWICVNAGVVEKHDLPERVEGDFEGFGPLVGGTRLVVQLFTAEKRAELDLETLWEGRLTRAQREREKHSNVAKDDAPPEVRDSSSVTSSPSDYVSPHVPRSSISLPLEQRRQFHSKSRQPFERPWHKTAFTRSLSQTLQAVPLSTHILLKHVDSLPHEQVRVLLGDYPQESKTTDFVRLFNDSLSGASASTKTLAELHLACSAYLHGHTGISRESIYWGFMDCCVAASMSHNVGLMVIDVLLTPRQSEGPDGEEWFTDTDKEMAAAVLDQLVLRGHDFMNLQYFARLYHLASLPPGPPGAEGSDDGVTPAERGARVIRMIETLDIPFDPIHARALMVSLFNSGDYENFEKWWRKLPLKDSPRTYEDYVLLFQLHAESGNSAQTRECINTWVPMMSRESPPIPFGHRLAENLSRCVLLADENAPTKVAQDTPSPLAKLWRECKSKIQDESRREVA
ncbi:ATPase synthesis protein 25, mitochondrial [Aspergillus multicolor]|uniref:RsfS/YbeB/iojap family protein n=1 Tax=Aspergillus multicolor TaxID=41759 RepID=UPI003CCD2FFA